MIDTVAVADRRAQIESRAVLAIVLLAFALGLGRLAAYVRISFVFPYGFDYGEGVVWQQMRDMLAGTAYQPIGLYPAVAYEYPPLYHLVTAATAWVAGMDPLYAGRAVSLACTGLCAILLGWLTVRCIDGQSRPVKIGAAAIAALAFATMPVLTTWALLMRIDMLACALTLAGMLLVSYAPRSFVATVAAGLAFTAALYTRQTCLPGPAAAFVVLLLVSPRRAWTMAAVSVVSGLVALAAIESATNGGFLLNIVSYNVNRMFWDRAGEIAMENVPHVGVIALAVVAAIAALRGLRLRSLPDIRAAAAGNPALAVVLLVLVFKTLMLPIRLKSGAAENYLIDWFIPICVLAGLAAIPLLRAATGLSAKPSMLLYVLFAIGFPLRASQAEPPPSPAAIEDQRKNLARIVALVRESDRPVISDDATLLLRAGKPMGFEPGIVAELTKFGRYDEAHLVGMIRRKEFGFFISEGDKGKRLFEDRFNPEVIKAMHDAYPQHLVIGGRTLHLPAPSQGVH